MYLEHVATNVDLLVEPFETDLTCVGGLLATVQVPVDSKSIVSCVRLGTDFAFILAGASMLYKGS